MFSIHNLPNKLPGEEVVKVVRRDVFILFKKKALFVLMVVLPMVFYWVISGVFSDLMMTEAFKALLTLGASAYYLFTWLFFFFSFIDYYLDIWVITTHRIIDIEQKGFFSRVIAEHKHFRIQDVVSETHGIVPTLLKYGNVHVQTAGTKQRFMFHEVPHPDQVRDLVIRLVQKNRKEMINEQKLSQ